MKLVSSHKIFIISFHLNYIMSVYLISMKLTLTSLKVGMKIDAWISELLKLYLLKLVI